MSSHNEAITFGSIVNDVIQSYPATTNVFNAFGIDACCGGAVSIHDAALRDGADATGLLNALNTVIARDRQSAGTAAA